MLILHGCILVATDPARWENNHFNLGQRVGMSGILCLGAGLLIVTGGVDLSIGSVVGLCACAFCWTTLKIHANLVDDGVATETASLCSLTGGTVVALVIGALVGLANGILVTYVRVQAFVVTLCGLFLPRAARWISGGEIPHRVSKISTPSSPAATLVAIYLWLLFFLVAITSVFLHLTIYGRYFFAIGSNEARTLLRHQHRLVQDSRLRALLDLRGNLRADPRRAFQLGRPVGHGQFP